MTSATAPSASANPRPAARFAGAPLVFGLAVGGVTTGAYLGASLIRVAGGLGVPIASLAALGLLASTPPLTRVARWAGSPRPERAASFCLAGAAPLLFLGAKIAIGNDPVVSSHWRCGTGDMGLMILSPIAFMLSGSLAGLLAFGLTGARERRGLGTWTGIVARGGLIFAAILVAAATLRALHRPSTDATSRYLESLPTVAVLPPINPATAKVTISPRESAPLTQLEDETPFRDITARRRCSEGSCTVALRRTDSAPPAESMWARSGGIPGDRSVVVQRDEKHGFWIVGGRSAFRDEDLRLTDISVEDVGDELSAPTGWIVGGALGVVVALALWAGRLRLSQRLLRIEGAREGVLGASGWITFHDDLPGFRASPDLALAAGPVTLIGGGAASGSAAAYRSEGAFAGETIVAGAREDLAAALRSRVNDLDALGLVSVMLTAAPLLASWGSNLLF